MEAHPVEETAGQSAAKSETATTAPANDKVARKKEMLAEQIESLKFKLEQTQRKLDDTHEQLGSVDAAARVQRHIKLLHDYNEIKDIGLGLFGMIAERRGVRVKEVFEEFGVSEDD